MEMEESTVGHSITVNNGLHTNVDQITNSSSL